MRARPHDEAEPLAAARPRARRRAGHADASPLAAGAGTRPRPPGATTPRPNRSPARQSRSSSDGLLNNQGDALCDLAEVLAAAGRTDEAAEALEQALKRYERKKNLAMVAQVRTKLEALRAGATS